MDTAHHLAVARAKGVVQAIGVAVCVCGPLAAAIPAASVRPGVGIGFAGVGGSLVAAARGRHRAQVVLAACAPLAPLVDMLLSGQLRFLSAILAGLLAAALVVERTSARAASWLSAGAAFLAIAALVDRVGVLDRPASALRPALTVILLGLIAATAVQALLVDRVGFVHALWGQASLRARMLRSFVLPLPFVLAIPVLVMLVVLDDPDHVRLLGRWAIATVPAVTAASAFLGTRVVGRSTGELRDLSEATGRIAEGRYDESLPASPSDEIGRLAGSFESMRASLRERRELEGILREAVHAVTTPPDLASAFEALGEVVARLVPNDRLAFSMYEDGELRVLAVHGPEAWRLPVGSTLDVDGELFRGATAHGEPVVVRDTDVPGAGSSERLLREKGFRSFVSVPVALRGETRAFVSIGSLKPDNFRDEGVDLFREIVRDTGGPLVTLALLDTERETAERLRELDALKTEFVGVVAHDLRSPMTVISGYVDLVISRWDDIPDDQKRELLQAASRGTKRLSLLVEDILTVARIESGSFPIEPRRFDLPSLISRTVGDFAVSHPDREIDAIVPTDLPPAFGDEDRNWQILTNLVSNALKFSPVGMPVIVSAGTDGDMLAVHVRDSGVGVAAEDLPRLFQKFSRIGRPVSEKTQGNGLGLYICRALVEAQGGSISMSSTPGEGSCVTYTIPIAREST